MFDPSPIHIVLLLGILLLVFGTKRLPEMGRSLGRGIREFKGSVTGHDDERLTSPTEDARPAATEAGIHRESAESERARHPVG
jgi:sec-independent protein translocase protein TatA